MKYIAHNSLYHFTIKEFTLVTKRPTKAEIIKFKHFSFFMKKIIKFSIFRASVYFQKTKL